MSSFLTELKVQRLEGKFWRVLEPFEYRVSTLSSPIVIVVEAGFVTDFGSIPPWLWSLYPGVGGPYDKAYVIHDKLYQEPWVEQEMLAQAPVKVTINRKFADDTLREAIGVLGGGRVDRLVIYSGVRVGGQGIWDRYRAR